MKSGRFFVTSVVLFAMAAVVACNQPGHREDVGDSNSAQAKAQSAEAKDVMEQVQALHQDLKKKYSLFIASEPKIRNNQVIHTRDFVTVFDWKSVRLNGRRDIQAKLNLFTQLVSRLLEIDKKSDRGQLEMWLESAQMFQQSLATFERTYGVNYDPDQDGKNEPNPLGGNKNREGIEI